MTAILIFVRIAILVLTVLLMITIMVIIFIREVQQHYNLTVRIVFAYMVACYIMCCKCMHVGFWFIRTFFVLCGSCFQLLTCGCVRPISCLISYIYVSVQVRRETIMVRNKKTCICTERISQRIIYCVIISMLTLYALFSVQTQPSLQAVRAETMVDGLPRACRWLVETVYFRYYTSNMACRDGTSITTG